MLTRTADRIHIEIDGQPFSDFYFGPDAPKPYLYPLRSASEKIVTRRLPWRRWRAKPPPTSTIVRCGWDSSWSMATITGKTIILL